MRDIHPIAHGIAQAALRPAGLTDAPAPPASRGPTRRPGRVAAGWLAAFCVLLPPPAHAGDPLAIAGAAQGTGPAAPVGAKHGMVVTAQSLASEAGAPILAQGGHAAGSG